MSKKKLPFIENLEIIDIASDGKAVGKNNERVVFVQKLVPGDVADVQVFKKKKGYFEAFVKEVKTYSPKRAEPFCSHFGQCGGCKWQNMKYEDQLFFKQKQVSEQLKRIGDLNFPEINKIIASEKDKFYRNKMEYSFCDKRWLDQEEIDSGKIFDVRKALGFHVPGKFDKVLQVEKCYLQEEPSNLIRNAVHKYAVENELSYYNPRKHEGLLRNLMIRISKAGEQMVVVIASEMNEDLQRLMDFIHNEFPQIDSLMYVINDKKNDSIHDLQPKLWRGKDFIIENLDGLNFRIGPKSFFQTNTYQAENLYRKVKDMLAPRKDEIVWDLFSGTGSISLYLARFIRKVIGIEIVEEAVEDAFENARLNKIENADFVAGDMKDVLTEEFVNSLEKPDSLVLDPPRAGVHKDAIRVIKSILPGKIIYVSCNPATQARDISMLKEYYDIVEVQPVDMFPQTQHVENIVKLIKK